MWNLKKSCETKHIQIIGREQTGKEMFMMYYEVKIAGGTVECI